MQSDVKDILGAPMITSSITSMYISGSHFCHVISAQFHKPVSG